MTVINLTTHTVDVYSESQFVNLEQLNPTTWVADGVLGEPIATYPSQGVARITTKTSPVVHYNDDLDGVELVTTEYGEATGLPKDLQYDETIIVSLPMQSMAKAAKLEAAPLMVSPYKVVRDRTNGSLVLGCMGFTQ